MTEENKGSVLIIDDSEIVLAELKRALTAAGYTVVATTQTVGAARHLLRAELVILDYHMPGIDGHQVLESLRGATRSLEQKPVFYVYTTDHDRVSQYREMGFDGAFTDKGDTPALVRQVAAAFRLLRMRRM